MYKPNSVCDVNTLAAPSNTRHVEPYMEALALNAIVEEIMEDDGSDESCVVYSNNGSSKSGVGAYVVQCLIINGKHRNLPTLAVCSESRDTLAELTKLTLNFSSSIWI